MATYPVKEVIATALYVAAILKEFDAVYEESRTAVADRAIERGGPNVNLSGVWFDAFVRQEQERRTGRDYPTGQIEKYGASWARYISEQEGKE